MIYYPLAIWLGDYKLADLCVRSYRSQDFLLLRWDTFPHVSQKKKIMHIYVPQIRMIMGNSPPRIWLPRPRREKISLAHPHSCKSSYGRFFFHPICIMEFIPVENPSPLGKNTILRVKFKFIISNEYNLNKPDLKLQDASTLEFSLLFYNRLCIKFLV